MSPVYGTIEGNICPHCKEEIEIEGDFSTNEEIECVCGAIVVISDIEAAYKLKMDLICFPPETDDEDRATED